jgi:hypothetical protein
MVRLYAANHRCWYCFEPGVIYLNGSSAGRHIVLNGGAVTVRATPLHGRLRPTRQALSTQQTPTYTDYVQIPVG